MKNQKNLTFATLMSLLVITPVYLQSKLASPVLAKTAEVCPKYNGWAVEEDEHLTPSRFLDLYPVPEASQYCFKAGADLLITPNTPEWELNDDDEVVIDGQDNGLSHWSYYLSSDNTDSQTPPDNSDGGDKQPDPSVTDTPTPSPTETDPDPTGEEKSGSDEEPAPTPTPTCNPGSNRNELGVCEHPQPQNDPESDSPRGGLIAEANDTDQSTGQVLAAKTMADTGVATTGLFNLFGALGTYLMGLSLKKKNR